MLKMEQRHWIIVESILSRYPYKIAAFGSRVKGEPKKFSDLDLCIMEPVTDLVLAQINEDFQESDLPFLVDLVIWDRCSKTFQEGILSELLIIS